VAHIPGSSKHYGSWRSSHVAPRTPDECPCPLLAGSVPFLTSGSLRILSKPRNRVSGRRFAASFPLAADILPSRCSTLRETAVFFCSFVHLIFPFAGRRGITCSRWGTPRREKGVYLAAKASKSLQHVSADRYCNPSSRFM
jgi:hypothetical protein